MENTTFTQSNYRQDYNTFQLFLPLDLSVSIPEDDIVFIYVEILKGVDLTKYIVNHVPHGNQKLNPIDMLYTVLFSFVDLGHPSLRDMEKACKTDIRYMYLSKETRPSHEAFCRFINTQLIGSVKDIFYDINKKLIAEQEIDLEKLYIDGTKLEAYARKTSFVWKKAILKFREKLYKKISVCINEMNNEILHLMNFEVKESYKPEDVRKVISYLQLLIERNHIQFVHGTGKRKTAYQKYYEKFNEYEEKLVEYEIHLKILGNRNSYSKTDHDATFMNMKYDYYNRTGVFKPGYNLQIGVSNEYIVHLGLYPNPTDTLTFIPFMESFHQIYERYPKYPVADAGYGSLENYIYCKEHDMALSMKYSYFDKLNFDKKFKKKIYDSRNFEINEEGYKVCPEGHAFDQLVKETESKTKIMGYEVKQSYYITGKCANCPVKSLCTKAKGDRQVSRNTQLEEYYKEADALLLSEEGKKLRKQRSIQAEGTFGIMKEDQKFTRMNRRSQERVELEMYLYAIGANIRKYYNKKRRETETKIS